MKDKNIKVPKKYKFKPITGTDIELKKNPIKDAIEENLTKLDNLILKKALELACEDLRFEMRQCRELEYDDCCLDNCETCKEPCYIKGDSSIKNYINLAIETLKEVKE